MPKVTVVGAGNVGSDLARRILERHLADVALIDIVEGLPQGRALDLMEASPIEGYENKITGSNNLADMAGSDAVVVTAGLARKPGMSRDDLLFKNAEIVGSIIEKIPQFAPQSVIVMVTNPLDVVTYLALKKSGFDRKRVLGMAGMLDTARMETFISMELGVPAVDVKAMVLGSHGDLMVPVLSQTWVKGRPLSSLMPQEKIDAIIQRTKNGGAEIVNLLKTGSAFYAPAASTADMVQAIINDTEEEMPVSAYLTGEYGLSDICIGVPAKLGKGGIEEIIKLDLTGAEAEALKRSAASIKENINKLPH
jgi:malate dehydrogenase